jgi:hypothetical protein
MSRSRSRSFLEKSVAAAVSAIELYNKPDFRYREEAFSILMVNAWELLLKARILTLNGNRLSALYVWEQRQKKDGSRGRRRVPRRNRAGNPMTIGVPKALDVLIGLGETFLAGACRENIEVLTEIRDNAIHFRHSDKDLARKVQEVGTACLRNFLILVDRWFDHDLSAYNFYLMPLSLFHPFELESRSVNRRQVQLENLLAYIARQELSHESEEQREFNVSLRLETRFVKAQSSDAIPFARVDDPAHITINISEEEALKRYPLDYEQLTSTLRRRYTDFVADDRYHALRQQLEAEPRLCRMRLLDPRNPHGMKKKFFSSEIVKEFDKHYKRRREGGLPPSDAR